jgi:hypothetical protein
MKISICILALLLCLLTLKTYSQTNKYWTVGRKVGIDFNSGIGVIDTANSNKYASHGTIAQIADDNGNNLFWSNGYVVLDKNYDTLPNGTNFNHSINDNQYINAGSGLPINNGCVIVPNPKDTDNLFWMFYMNVGFTDAQGGYLPSQLKCLLIDKRLNGGLGDVVFKDSILISDTLIDGNLFAIKHGNGKNWWVIARQYHSNKFYKILIDSLGINPFITQNIGIKYTAPYFFSGSADVNAQGDKIAYPMDIYNVPSGVSNPMLQIDLLDFDRCNGSFLNSKSIQYNFYPDTCEISSVCFSPDGKVLYGNRLTKLYQFYLDSSNIYQSKKLIQRYNGAVCSNPSWFWIPKRGVDDKIYLTIYGGGTCMHVVNNPNVIGASCNFVQNQISCSVYHVFDDGIPNTPNYTLGAVNCAIGIENLASKNEAVNVYPNPCEEKLLVFGDWLLGNPKIAVMNILGMDMNIQYSKSNNQCTINTSNLSKGLYLLKATDEKGNTKTTKFIKQ